MTLWDSREHSNAARMATLPRLKTRKRKILDAIAFRASTDDELEQALGIRHQSLSSARRSLVLDGLVEKSIESRETSSGCLAQVWRITYKAEIMLRRKTDD